MAEGPQLTPRQQRILFALVEWDREPDSDGEFMLIETQGGASFIGHEAEGFTRADVEQLAVKGLVHARAPKGTLIVSPTAEGHQYYEVHQQQGHPAEVLAERVRQYVDARAAEEYTDAAEWLRAAADDLWAARKGADVVSVGSKCREALQRFSQAYYARFYPNADQEPLPKERTLDAVSKVVRHLHQTRGETDSAFDDALFGFWRALVDSDQKVVHGSSDLARPVDWEHGRRVLLYSYLVIGELHMLATGERTSGSLTGR